MIWSFIGGMFVGALIGIVVLAFLTTAKRADEIMRGGDKRG